MGVITYSFNLDISPKMSYGVLEWYVTQWQANNFVIKDLVTKRGVIFARLCILQLLRILASYFMSLSWLCLLFPCDEVHSMHFVRNTTPSIVCPSSHLIPEDTGRYFPSIGKVSFDHLDKKESMCSPL